MYITNFLNEQRQHEQTRHRDFLIESDRQGAGRGMESRSCATCPTCDRATVLEVHEYTPQLSLLAEEQRDGVWYSCEWCGSEIEPRDLNVPRKPAASAGEPDEEWARRVA
jgi:hypothetical protein